MTTLADFNKTCVLIGSDVDTGRPLGVVGATSGGDSTFGWVASEGLENGKTITVSSDTLTFNPPDKHIYLGFGQGWLYENEDGAVMPSSVSVGGEGFIYEGSSYNDAKRKIVVSNDDRFLRSVLFKPENSNQDYNAGFISWDTGADLSSGDTAFTFGRVRAVKEGGGTVQWKQERIGPNNNLEGENGNSAYLKDLAGYMSLTVYPGNTQALSYGTSAPRTRTTNEWSSVAWSWEQNTPDVNDGSMYTRCKVEGSTGFNLSTPNFSSTTPPAPLGSIKSTPTDKPRWIKRQDYIGNNNDNEDNIVIDVTDLYWKVNGDLFLLADSSDLSLCIDEPIPLIPTQFSGDLKSVDLRLWKGLMPSFSGMFLHRLDSNMQPVNVVEL